MIKCPNCGNQKVDDTYTKSPGSKELRGHHYLCSKCDFEWQSRSVKRYRQRITESKDLLTLLFVKRSLLSAQDRFFVEKSYAQQKSSLKYRSRFLRIANKIDIDLLREYNDNIVSIPNGFNHKLYSGVSQSKARKILKIDKKDMIIYSLGDLIERKGFLDLLKAFRKFSKRRPNVKLFIGGNGPLKNKLQSFIAQNDLENVKLL